MAMTRGYTLFHLLMSAFVAACFLLPAPSQAQFFDMDNESLAPSAGFSKENPQLQDILRLQHQLQVLKQLIDHQKAANDILKSAVNLGLVDPVVPQPNRSLCGLVPANIPCAQAYSNMYDGFSVERQKPIVPITVAPPAPGIMEQSDIPSLAAAALPELPSDLAAGDTIYWTDITCLGSTCSAVISPNPGNSRSRYRVTKGEKLPDGSVIKDISAAGVSIERGSKTIRLEPAPNNAPAAS